MMNLVCVICSDLLTPSDDVFHTPCGHIFHYVCLIQWLERSTTCPQCRERTTYDKIHRIYFNFSNNDSIKEDVTCLQAKIDSLNFQLTLKDRKVSVLTELNEKLENQTVGLRHEIKKVESEINGQNSAIHALKEQVRFYKQQCSDIDNFRKENKHLKKDLENLKNVQSVIDDSISKVDEIILLTNDSNKLKTYIAVLKREMSIMTNKSKEVRDKCKRLQQDYMCVSTKNKVLMEDCTTKLKKLEERLILCETEKASLQTQLDMQANAYKYATNEVFAEKRENLEAHKEYNTVEKSNGVMSECESKLGDTLKLKDNKSDSCIMIDSTNCTENTPQSMKSQGFFSTEFHGIKRQKSNVQVPSILVKKSRFDQPNRKTASDSGMSFDGFGGHAKYDKFPNPISSIHVKKIKEDSSRMRKLKLDMGDNQKINDILMCNNLI